MLGNQWKPSWMLDAYRINVIVLGINGNLSWKLGNQYDFVFLNHFFSFSRNIVSSAFFFTFFISGKVFFNLKEKNAKIKIKSKKILEQI